MSVQRFVSQIPYLIGIAASGWLADLGLFADVFGNKYSFVFITAGVCAAIAYVFGFFVPSLINAEQLMSDNNSLVDG